MNLDLNAYNNDELEKLFKLPQHYTLEDVSEKEYAIRSRLLKEDMDPQLLIKLNDFFHLAKTRLVNDFVIIKSVPASVAANVEPYVQGTINPYQRRTMIKNVNIDTIFRPNYDKTTSSDFVVLLPDSLRNVISMRLTSVELPNMINQFSTSDKSNFFEITSNLASAVVTKTIYIPDGDYQSNVFQTTMNNILTSNGFPYLILEVTIQGRIRIRARLPGEGPSVYVAGEYYFPEFTFRIVITPTDCLRPHRTAGWNMGFRKAYYNSTSITDYETGLAYPAQILSESMYGSTVDNYVFMEVDDYHNNFQTDTIQSSVGQSYIGKNILGRIGLTGNSFTIIESTPADGVFRNREYFGPVRLERLHIRLLNKYGEIINLNGNDYSFVLEFEIIYS